MENQFSERSKKLMKEYNLYNKNVNKLGSYSKNLIAMGIDLKDFENFFSNYNAVSAQMQEIEDLKAEIEYLKNMKKRYNWNDRYLETHIDKKSRKHLTGKQKKLFTEKISALKQDKRIWAENVEKNERQNK